MRRHLRCQCLGVLRDVFGVEGFRPGQEEAAGALLSGQDLLCVLPTGAGKSLCWQLPAILRGGLTVVISPLIALMHDQARHLRDKGIPAICLDSLMSPAEHEQALEQLRSGEANIVLLAPERLNHPAFRQLCQARSPQMLVVDEAHCLIQWGETFRPAYQGLLEFIEALPRRPVLCAMTATADAKIRRGILEALGMQDCRTVILPVLRENLRYLAQYAPQPLNVILPFLRSCPGKAVIFCQYRKRAEALAEKLTGLQIPAACYHAGLERADRLAAQERFVRGEVRVIVATSAFGMGVDIPDIRLIIHDHLPDSIIDYAQQSGRAGRDGQAAVCLLLITPFSLFAQSRRLRKALHKAHSPLERLDVLRREWLPRRGMLRLALTSPCLTQTLSRAFGHRVRRCGRCSACESGRLATSVPPLYRLGDTALTLWLLRFHRSMLSRACHQPEDTLLSDQAAVRAAKSRQLPPNTPYVDTYAPIFSALANQ